MINNNEVKMMASSVNQISVILFDLGGVLVQLKGIPTLLSWVGDRMTLEEMWASWLSSPAVRSFETGQMDPEVFANELIGEMDLPVKAEEFLEEFASWPNDLFPGALQLVGRIPRNYVRATLSNTNSMHWPRLMDEMRLGDVFDYYFASHLIGRIKPDEDAFQYVIEALERSPAEILFLDDNHLNVEAAKRTGMKAVQVKGTEEAGEVLSELRVII
ncbi:MAG: HAD-IA family hydrolase [Chloracidobacterium sp.]|nr:HAD-IA family hydrolase [Chloracidobacterium sp.]